MAFKKNQIVVLARDGSIAGESAWKAKFRKVARILLQAVVCVISSTLLKMRSRWHAWAKLPTDPPEEQNREQVYKDARDHIAMMLCFLGFVLLLANDMPKLFVIFAGVETFAIVIENLARRDAMRRADEELCKQSYEIASKIVTRFITMVLVLTVVSWLIVDGKANIGEYIPALKELSEMQLGLVNEALAFVMEKIHR